MLSTSQHQGSIRCRLQREDVASRDERRQVVGSGKVVGEDPLVQPDFAAHACNRHAQRWGPYPRFRIGAGTVCSARGVRAPGVCFSAAVEASRRMSGRASAKRSNGVFGRSIAIECWRADTAARVQSTQDRGTAVRSALARSSPAVVTHNQRHRPTGSALPLGPEGEPRSHG